MSLLTRIAGKAASDTIMKIGARILRDQKMRQEGYEAGYKEGYADAKAGKPQKVK